MLEKIMINAPCYKCEERHINCHSECDKYKVYKEDVKRFHENVDKANVYCAKPSFDRIIKRMKREGRLK